MTEICKAPTQRLKEVNRQNAHNVHRHEFNTHTKHNAHNVHRQEE